MHTICWLRLGILLFLSQGHRFSQVPQTSNCMSNLLLKKKKKERKSHPPLPAQIQEAVLVQNVLFCLPLQSSVPPSRERHTFCALSFLQCCSHRRNSARKAISCKNSGQRRNKNKTSTCVLNPTPQAHCFLPNFDPPSGGDLGQCWEKLFSPRRIYWAHFRVCNPQVFQLFLTFPLWEAAQHLQPALGTGRKLLKGSVPTVCIALNNQDQVVSGITRVIRSSRLWTTSWNEHPSAVSGWTITAGMGLSLPAAEHSTYWDCHRKILCSILSFKLIFTCSTIHVEQNLPIQTRPSKVLQVFQTEGNKKQQKKTKKKRTGCKSVWFDIASEIIKKPIF